MHFQKYIYISTVYNLTIAFSMLLHLDFFENMVNEDAEDKELNVDSNDIV